MNNIINETGIAIRDYVIESFAQFTSLNTTFSDESALEYVVRNHDTVPYCCVVTFGGGYDMGNTEFASSMFGFRFDIQFFELLIGAEDSNYTDAVMEVNQFASEMLYLVSTDSTLGSSVMDATVERITPPMIYSRTPINKFHNVTVRINVTENIS